MGVKAAEMLKRCQPSSGNVERRMVEQSHKNYIKMFRACKGIISRSEVKKAFKVYTINRERYFLKELETAKEQLAKIVYVCFPVKYISLYAFVTKWDG